MTTPNPSALAPVLDPERLAAGLAQLRSDRTALEQLQITSPELAQACGQVLIQTLRQHDALKAERDRVVMPIHAAYKNASETYAPHLKESEACIAALKRAIGAWELAQAKVKQQAFQIAQAAVQVSVTAPDASAPDVSAVVDAALTVAAQDTGRAAGVGVRFEWTVKRIDNPDPRKSMLASEYWEPNMKAIEAEIDRQKKSGSVRPEEGGAPVIPGVIFELVPSVSGRR